MVLCPIHVDHVPAVAPHPVIGPILDGHTKTLINGRFAARQGDFGLHAGCMGPNLFIIAQGSGVVDIDGRPAARQGDITLHCGIQPGFILNGAPNVLIGDAPYGGGGPPLAPTPRVAAAQQQQRDELNTQGGGGGPVDNAARPDQAGDGEPGTRALPAAVQAEPAEPLAAPPAGVTPQQVEQDLKKDTGQPDEPAKPVVIVAGTISDTAGIPIPRETVLLLPEQGDAEVARSELDARGRYLFRDVAAGTYRLAVLDPDSEPWTEVPLPEPAAGAAQAKDWPADGPHLLLVRVVDSGLAPQPEMSYRLKLPGGVREGRTDKLGVLCEPSVPAGTLELELAGKAHPVPSQSPAARVLAPFDLVLAAGAGEQARPFLHQPEAAHPLGTLDPVADGLWEL